MCVESGGSQAWLDFPPSELPEAQQTAILDYSLPVAECFGFFHTVSGEEYGSVLIAVLSQKRPQIATGLRIEARSGLIQHHELWSAQSGDTHQHPPPQTAGEVLNGDITMLGKPQLIYNFVGAAAGSLWRLASQFAENSEGLVYGKVPAENLLVTLYSQSLRP